MDALEADYAAAVETHDRARDEWHVALCDPARSEAELERLRRRMSEASDRERVAEAALPPLDLERMG